MTDVQLSYQSVLDAEVKLPPYPVEQVLIASCMMFTEVANWQACREALGISSKGKACLFSIDDISEIDRPTSQARIYCGVVNNLQMESDSRCHKSCAFFCSVSGGSRPLPRIQ